MLLDYLYANFHEEHEFASKAKLKIEGLRKIIKLRTMPRASYILEGDFQLVSFVNTCNNRQIYRFHLKSHLNWIVLLQRLGLETEKRAQNYFSTRYNQARTAFFSSPLGQELIFEAPDVPARFNTEHASATWDYFLDGVYGVCTRDGMPETIFLKQVGVMFIEQITTVPPNSLSNKQRATLSKAVSFLNSVESDFAPHEVSKTSRQRCINSVREAYLGSVTA